MADEEQFDLDFEVQPVLHTAGGTELVASAELISSEESTAQALALLQETEPQAEHEQAETSRIEDLSTEQKAERAIEAIMRLLEERHPLSVAYSGGKDSSVMMSLTLEAARRCKESGMDVPPILVTHARTGIDNPAMDMVAQAEIARIRVYSEEQGLPVRVDIVEPSLNDTWAVRIISGRALPTFANSATRDCAISWKLIPQKRQRKAAFQELKTAGEPVVLVGTRFDESSGRAARMTERGELDTEIWVSPVLNSTGQVQREELRLSPIAYWSQEDVWVFLSELTSGERKSFTDAKDIWDVYRDGGNSSCVVVADDTMKANSKACGARFGCALCTAVGRDKSLESMIEADEKYQFLLPLNRLQRFLVDTQYDMERRLWLGRTIQDDGYIAIAPDAYSPQMQRDLLAYALTIDRDERQAAAALGMPPRFQLVSEKQLLAIDAIWSIQGYHPRPFEAIHIWEDVCVEGNSYYPPEVDASQFSKKIPSARWLYVGSWDNDPGFSTMYTGARNLLADISGSSEQGGCLQNIELGDGRVVLAMESSDMLEVDEEGAELFLEFDVLDRGIHKEYERAGYTSDAAFRHYQVIGTLSTGKRHLGIIDDMLRRAAWKRRHEMFELSTSELLDLSVSTAQRKEGVRAAPGRLTLAEELAIATEEAHERRCRGSLERQRG
jgi:DNA sulfur modification protein DndC